ncbi:hypothetical protein IRJ41_025205, partial [Triplophysa rosa]
STRTLNSIIKFPKHLSHAEGKLESSRGQCAGARSAGERVPLTVRRSRSVSTGPVQQSLAHRVSPEYFSTVSTVGFSCCRCGLGDVEVVLGMTEYQH